MKREAEPGKKAGTGVFEGRQIIYTHSHLPYVNESQWIPELNNIKSQSDPTLPRLAIIVKCPYPTTWQVGFKAKNDCHKAVIAGIKMLGHSE